MSDYRKVSALHTFCLSKATNGVGEAMEVANYMNVVIAITATNATIKVQGSIQDSSDGSLTIPDFSIAASPTNQWDYIQLKQYEDDSSHNGDEGIEFTTADTGIYEFNTNGLSWVNIIVSSNTGSVTVRGKGYATE